MSYPIVVSNNVLNEEQWTLFNNELEESQIDYLQKYPRRLFSTEKHQHTEQRSRDVSTGRHPLKFDGVANNNGHRTHQNREVSKT